jgi:sugar/nucleoside kinase (ribokinase family)
VDGVVVADYEEYGAGTITAAVLDRLLAIARAGRVPCLVMSRTHVTDFLPFLPVQNEYEVVTQTGVGQRGIFEPVPDEELVRGVGALLAGGAPGVYVTRGRRGISVFAADGGRTLVPTAPAPEPVDTCGAGDTVLAAVAAALGAGAAPEEAALLANCAAYVTVQKLGTTGTASPPEVRDAFAAIAAAAGH